MTAPTPAPKELNVAYGSKNTLVLTQPGEIYELLYCPNEHIILVLDEPGLAELEALDKKLDQAAEQLEAARTQTGSDHRNLLQAQDGVRAALAEAVAGDGSAGTKKLAPLAKGRVGLQEMMRIGAAKYSLIPADFVEKYKARPGHLYQMPGTIKGALSEVINAEPVEDSLKGWRYTQADQAADGSKKAGELNRDKVIETFGKVKTKIAKDWKLAKGETTGQIPSERLIKTLLPTLSAFLTKDNYALIDNWIEKINQDANASWKRYEQYRDDALKALDKTTSRSETNPANYFLPEDWDFVKRMVGDIWGKSSDLYLDLRDVPYKTVCGKEGREHYKDLIARKPLPPTCWDASAGAQFMRYTLGATVKAEFDLLKKGKLAVGADASFDAALAEAKAEGRFMFPNSEGHCLRPKIKVKTEEIVPKPYGKSAGIDYRKNNFNQQADTPYFAVDDSLLTPSGADNLFAMLQHWEVLAQTVNRTNTDAGRRDLFIQVVGHTSATGSNDYNDRLGQRRAAIVADFIAQKLENWIGHFKSSHWGRAEVDFMAYVILIRSGSIPAAVNWDLVGRSETKASLVDQIKQQVPNLEEMRQQILPQLQRMLFLSKAQWDEPHPSFRNGKPKTKLQRLIEQYSEALRLYASQQNQTRITWDYNLLSNIRLFSTPYISKGETAPAVATDQEIFENRRCDFIAWEIDREHSKVVEKEVELYLGEMRATFEGSISAWAGANVNLGGEIALAAPQGMLAVVGAVRDESRAGKVSDKTIVQAKGALEAGANAGAFAGAKAELGMRASVDWRPPPKDPAPGKSHQPPQFGALGSAGYTLTGMLGIGATAEFKVGFDQDSSRFVIKMKAEACLGPGCGGQLNITVGVGQCWAFITLIHGELKRHNFSYLDIFEKEDDESGLDVFEVYSAWAWKMLQRGNIWAGPAFAVGKSVEMIVECLTDVRVLIGEWQQKEALREQTDSLINTLKTKPELIKYLTPESKGRILYDLMTVEVGMGEYLGNLVEFDVNKKREEAALILIEEGVVSQRDWRETLEHLGEIRGGELVPQVAPKADPVNKAERVMQNAHFLKSRLLNDPEDWDRLEQFISGLPK